jgi:hypothetical protein
VDDCILLLAMAFGALARGAHQGLTRLLCLDARALPVDEECPYDQCESNNNGYKNGSE